MEISLFSASSEGPTIDKENASKASDLLWFYLERGRKKDREDRGKREMKAGRRRDIYREEMRGNWAPVPRRSSPSPLRPFLGPKQKRRVLKSLPRCQPQPQLRFLYHLSPCPVAASSPLCALALAVVVVALLQMLVATVFVLFVVVHFMGV